MAEPRLPQQHEYHQLGAYLRDLRVHFALDVMEVSRRTHIRAKYIQAIEDEQLEVMPGRVYARGYVVTYAEFFGLNAEDFASRYMAQFGVTQTPTKEEPTYFVPEPTRRKLSKRNTNAVVIAVAALLLAFAGWAMMGGDEQMPEPTVAAVPERLIEQLRTGAMVHPENAECLLGDARALACLDAQRMPAMPGYVQKPAMLFVERGTEESSNAEADAVLSADAPADAAEDAQAAPADAKKPKAAEAARSETASPAAAVVERPAATPQETAPVAATPAAVPAQPAAQTVPVVAPFKRQGEETPPATPAPVDEAAAPAAAAPAAEANPNAAPADEAKESDSLLPKEWFEPSDAAEKQYQDPNAPRQEGWSPRERRR